MKTYQKDRFALDSFEDRYISAMRARMGLELFLHAEMNTIEELVQKEENRIRSEQAKQQHKVETKVREKSIADRVLEENRLRIAKYPRLTIHEEASEDLERLFGAIGVVDRQFWADLERIMRSAYTSLIMSPRGRLEEQLLKLCASSDNLPPRLSRYSSLFNWFPRNYPEIDKEANKCILDAAFFLYDLEDTLKEIDSAEHLSTAERQKVVTIREYVHNVISDFRLKEFRHLQR